MVSLSYLPDFQVSMICFLQLQLTFAGVFFLFEKRNKIFNISWESTMHQAKRTKSLLWGGWESGKEAVCRRGHVLSRLHLRQWVMGDEGEQSERGAQGGELEQETLHPSVRNCGQGQPPGGDIVSFNFWGITDRYNCIYWKCTMWWYNRHIHCGMIAESQMISTPSVLHSQLLLLLLFLLLLLLLFPLFLPSSSFFFWWELKIYFKQLSSLQNIL